MFVFLVIVCKRGGTVDRPSIVFDLLICVSHSLIPFLHCNDLVGALGLVFGAAKTTYREFQRGGC